MALAHAMERGQPIRSLGPSRIHNSLGRRLFGSGLRAMWHSLQVALVRRFVSG